MVIYILNRPSKQAIPWAPGFANSPVHSQLLWNFLENRSIIFDILKREESQIRDGLSSHFFVCDQRFRVLRWFAGTRVFCSSVVSVCLFLIRALSSVSYINNILMSIIYYKNLIFPSIVRAFWKIPTKKSVQFGQISRLPGNPISLMLWPINQKWKIPSQKWLGIYDHLRSGWGLEHYSI